MATTFGDGKVAYNYLGKSGIKVSNICLGTMTFGDTPSFLMPQTCNEDASHEILNSFVKLGGNFLDCADFYRDGQSEEVLGRWLERQQRENLVIGTKVRLDMGTTHNINNVGLSRRHITDGLDKSLQRLHTDYVDLYQTHFWDKATPLEETLRTLDDLIRCGKVRYVGACNLSGWQLQKVVATTEKLGLNPFVTLQQQYNLLSRFSETEAFSVCKSEGLGVLPWSPLKGGLLTGRYKRGTTPTEGRIAWVSQNKLRVTEVGPNWTDISDRTFDIMDTADRIAQKLGRSSAQVALRWLLQKDVVCSVIVGASKISQLEDSMKASTGWTLSTEEMKELDDVSEQSLPYPYSMSNLVNSARHNPFLPPENVFNTTS